MSGYYPGYSKPYEPDDMDKFYKGGNDYMNNPSKNRNPYERGTQAHRDYEEGRKYMRRFYQD